MNPLEFKDYENMPEPKKTIGLMFYPIALMVWDNATEKDEMLNELFNFRNRLLSKVDKENPKARKWSFNIDDTI